MVVGATNNGFKDIVLFVFFLLSWLFLLFFVLKLFYVHFTLILKEPPPDRTGWAAGMFFSFLLLL